MKNRTIKKKKRNYVTAGIVLIVFQGILLRINSTQPDRFQFDSLGAILGYNVFAIFGLIYLIAAFKKEKEPKDRVANHKGLDKTGIIIMYVMSSFFMLISLNSWIYLGYLEVWDAFILMLSVVTIILTILYHTNKITNYILIGILGIFISIIGGIFILVGQPKTIKNSQSTEENGLSYLEYKLKQLDSLLIKGVLTKEEYDSKRQAVIDNE